MKTLKQFLNENSGRVFYHATARPQEHMDGEYQHPLFVADNLELSGNWNYHVQGYILRYTLSRKPKIKVIPSEDTETLDVLLHNPDPGDLAKFEEAWQGYDMVKFMDYDPLDHNKDVVSYLIIQPEFITAKVENLGESPIMDGLEESSSSSEKI